jgi:hypothetical protein
MQTRPLTLTIKHPSFGRRAGLTNTMGVLSVIEMFQQLRNHLAEMLTAIYHIEL